MTTEAQRQPGLPPHRYASHVATVMRFSRMYRNEAWRESVGLSVRPPQYRFAIALAGALVSVAWLVNCFYL